jgi:GntR family transcriptional regulator
MKPDRPDDRPSTEAGVVLSESEATAPLPVYLRLEKLLKERIHLGVLKPGSKLPSEHELAGHFQVSRSTIRKVLGRLAVDGLIVKWPGKGSYVSGKPLRMSPSSLSFSAQMIAAGYPLRTRVLLRRVVPIPRHVAEALNLPIDNQVIEFHRLRELNGEPVAIHRAFLPYPDYARITSEALATESLSHAMEWATGVQVVSSQDVVSVVPVHRADALMLEIPANSPVVVLRGVGFSQAGDPVRYAEAVYRSDRFEFAVNNAMPSNKLAGDRGAAHNPEAAPQ